MKRTVKHKSAAPAAIDKPHAISASGQQLIRNFKDAELDKYIYQLEYALKSGTANHMHHIWKANLIFAKDIKELREIKHLSVKELNTAKKPLWEAHIGQNIIRINPSKDEHNSIYIVDIDADTGDFDIITVSPIWPFSKGDHESWQMRRNFMWAKYTPAKQEPTIAITQSETERAEVKQKRPALQTYKERYPIIIGDGFQFIPEDFFTLHPGEAISHMGEKNKNGKETSSCREIDFDPPVTYVGRIFVDDKEFSDIKYAAFECHPAAIIAGNPTNEKIYILITDDGAYPIIQDFKGLRPLIYHPVFTIVPRADQRTDQAQQKTPAIEETATHATTNHTNTVSPKAENPLTADVMASEAQPRTTDIAQQEQPATPGNDLSTANCKLQTIKTVEYPGNKHSAGVWHKIINQIPPHDVWVSGTAGTCAVLSHKKPATSNIAIDVNAGAPVLQQYWAARTGVKLIKADFLTWIQQFNFSENTAQRWFIYLDPPYLFSTRRSGRIIYDHEWSDADHQRLIAWATLMTETSNIHIAISHYPCPEYDALLSCQGEPSRTWRKITYKTRHHVSTQDECLYMNYPEPEELHEYTCLGQDRIERQNNKRMATNILNKLKKLPPLRRNAILSQVAQLLQQVSATPPPVKRK